MKKILEEIVDWTSKDKIDSLHYLDWKKSYLTPKIDHFPHNYLQNVFFSLDDSPQNFSLNLFHGDQLRLFELNHTYHHPI